MMKTVFPRIAALVAIGLLATIPIALADTILDVVPDSIGSGDTTTLTICRTSSEQVLNITVTDPSGTVWTYNRVYPFAPATCPSTYDVAFGGSSAGWTSDDGDTSQSDESGTYTAIVQYIDYVTKTHEFTVKTFSVPELALPAVAVPSVALAYLALRNRLRRK